MAQNNKISQLDGPQIIKRVVDTDHDAIRVVQMHDQEVSIELAAEDGDSVLALPKNVILSGEADCKDFRSVGVYYKGTGTVKLQLSPADNGTAWATCVTLTAGVDLACSRVEIVGRRVRLVADVGVEAYLIGQS